MIYSIFTVFFKNKIAFIPFYLNPTGSFSFLFVIFIQSIDIHLYEIVIGGIRRIRIFKKHLIKIIVYDPVGVEYINLFCC